ncbi:MAG: tRNA guanosine(34) transglycosylase Tgt [Bacteroidales bacterium]|nr:tRNA guanosine(34) transglycosylase Tgt [Bacteroidales bacterium]
MEFRITSIDRQSSARCGVLTTAHGEVETPIFMPVGTQGTVKGIHQRDLADDAQAHIILGNTYHLFLRPGLEVLKAAGGLHRFIGWERPILTDSGGFQVFSLSDIRKLKEDGAEFRSHIDGSKHFFTPERVVDIQRTIGADVMMAFDECTPYPADYDYAKHSMERTLRWLNRGWKQFREGTQLYDYPQTFFPIVQGSVYPELRRISAEQTAEAGCEGNAIGGLAVGEPVEQMYEMIQLVNGILPVAKPRYLMGVGTPVNILESIALGVDMFDCVMPTRNGRNGSIFTRNGQINIKNEKWKNDFSPIEENGASFVDTQFSKAYLRHLVIAGEMLGSQISSLHNIAFYLWLVREAREKIKNGTFIVWKKEMVENLSRKL